MSVRFLSDDTGTTTDIVIPIEDWQEITSKYPDLNNLFNDIPDWQKKILDERLDFIKNHPDSLRPIEELLEALDN
jgi:hypothetical protein